MPSPSAASRNNPPHPHLLPRIPPPRGGISPNRRPKQKTKPRGRYLRRRAGFQYCYYIKPSVEKSRKTSYNNLTAAYSIVANTEEGVDKILAIPLSFPRTGLFSNGDIFNRSSSGSGYYWSSRPYINTGAYGLYFFGTTYIYQGFDDGSRRASMAVRCVVAEISKTPVEN